MNQSRPKIKICGITRLEDARYCAGAGADFLGFIQHPESPRYIEPARAREIIDWIYGPASVGVFVNRPPDEVNRIVEEAGFSWVQLHGHESPEDCLKIERPVIKALRVLHDASEEQIRAAIEPYHDVAALILLDTHHTSLWGGTGESFNWRVARALTSEYEILLAGGIDAENVEDALHTMRPYGVDLSSSVESSPGVKDFDRLAVFFERFEHAAASL